MSSQQLSRYNTRANARTQCNSEPSEPITPAKMSTCDISEGTKTYLDELMRMYTTELKSEIDELKTLLNKKNELIDELNARVIQVVQRIVELSDELRNSRIELEIKIDDNEQYSRKDSLRIEGIDFDAGETRQALGSKIVKCLGNLGAKVSMGDFHRYHRSSAPRTLTDGRVVSQTIVRFNNWAARANTLQASQTGTRKERLARPQFVRVDITKRRYALLKEAQKALDNHPVAHAFVSSECVLKVKNRRTNHEFSFNSHAELAPILAKLRALPIDPE